MGKKENAGSSAVFGIAATWFGMHCGSGFATGTQYTIYYNKYGWLALITPFITWGLLSIAMYFILEYSRMKQFDSHKNYAENAFIKKIGILFVVLLDFWCVFAQTLGEAGILAGCGSLFDGIGIGYWTGIIAGVVVVAAMVIFGGQTLMKASTYVTYGLIVSIAILGFVGVSRNWANFAAVVGGHQNDGGTFWEAVKSAFTYSGVQIGAIFALIPLAKNLRSTKEVAKTAFGGGLLNLLMLQILGLVMISFYPEINAETLPVLTALNNLGLTGLAWVYRIMLFLALISTGAGCAFAIVNRFSPYFEKWFKIGTMPARIIVFAILMFIGVFGSRFGLIAVFSTGYGYLSKMAWPLGILPAIIILPLRLAYMKKHNGEDYAI